MASYKVLKDQVTLPKKVGNRFSARDPEKKVDLVQHVVYTQDQVIQEDELSPALIERYNEGDERILRLIEKVPEKSAKSTKSRKK